MRQGEGMASSLPFSVNRFESAVVDPAALPEEAEGFAGGLEATMADCRGRGLRMIWLEIPEEKSGLIAEAVKVGFRFHHTGEGYLMLVLVLREGAEVPDFATHYIGIGGVVIDEADRLLVVAERAYHKPGEPLRYKLPGGALQSGEHLADAVVREVWEETGVKSEFEALVCFRHWHEYRYGKSDIYFVARMKPLTSEIRMQDDEIHDCRWMPVQEYLGLGHISPFNHAIVRAALRTKGLRRQVVPGYDHEGRCELLFPE